MAADPVERLRQCGEEAKRRRRESSSLTAELSSATPLSEAEVATATPPSERPSALSVTPKQRNGLTSEKIVTKASERLLEQEQLGLFTSIPIVAGNEYPTLLARLPIFPPVSEERQQKLLDKDNALPFNTAFGNGRRFGPLLTVRDEDVLQATSRLRFQRLQGRGGQLPIKIQQIFARGTNELFEVHAACFTLKQLCDELEWVKTGPNYRLALDSLRRVNGTVIELEVAKKERYFGALATRGAGFRLIDIAWDIYRQDGIVYVQFNPLVTMWLEKEFTYVNSNVRKQLSSQTSRALHRYLSSQPATYEDRLLKIADAVGIWVPPNKLTYTFSTALDQIAKTGWLTDYEITGTGRSSPKMLRIIRPTRKRADP